MSAHILRPTDSVRRAVESVPLFAGAGDLLIEAQTGTQSLNNSIWVVSDGSGDAAPERFAVRLVDPVSGEHLGIDRAEEAAVARAAAAAGVTPEILYYDTATGTMVTPWVEGTRSPGRADLHEPRVLRRLVEVVRRLHAVTEAPGMPEGAGRSAAVHARIRHLVDRARRSGLELPPGIDAALRRLDEIEAQSEAAATPPALNHNDLWENNVLDDGARLYLVDWEFSGFGDGRFDLATISMAGGFDARMDDVLLGEYGLAGPQAVAELEAAKWVVCLFEAVWSLVMQSIKGRRSESGFDYADHAAYMFASLAVGPR
jgi:thiamine kinase-like enzyme